MHQCKVSVHFCDIIDHLVGRNYCMTPRIRSQIVFGGHLLSILTQQDNEEGYDIVPGSDIVISRTADRDSNSK